MTVRVVFETEEAYEQLLEEVRAETREGVALELETQGKEMSAHQREVVGYETLSEKAWIDWSRWAANIARRGRGA